MAYIRHHFVTNGGLHLNLNRPRGFCLPSVAYDAHTRQAAILAKQTDAEPGAGQQLFSASSP